MQEAHSTHLQTCPVTVGSLVGEGPRACAASSAGKGEVRACSSLEGPGSADTTLDPPKFGRRSESGASSVGVLGDGCCEAREWWCRMLRTSSMSSLDAPPAISEKGGRCTPDIFAAKEVMP